MQKVCYNIYRKRGEKKNPSPTKIKKEVNEMIIAVIILAWLLVSTWITLAVICIDEGYRGDEWAGIIVACLFSPISVFIIRPIVLTVKRIKKAKKD
jgi:hypothetical protein